MGRYGFYGLVEVSASGFKGCYVDKVALAVAAAPMIEAKIGQAVFVASACQVDLLGRVAIGHQAVASDDKRGVFSIREVQRADKRQTVGFKRNGNRVEHGETPYAMKKKRLVITS
jgi:hypothetical protein